MLGNRLRDATKSALVERGLTETPNSPALFVECSVRRVDFGIDRMGRPVEQRGGRGARPRQPTARQRGFTEGTLVIDVIQADTKALIWRGVYHDTDADPSGIAWTSPNSWPVTVKSTNRSGRSRLPR